MTIPEIDVAAAAALLSTGTALFMDVRDPASHAAARIPGAVPVNDGNIQVFLDTIDRARKVIVYCYHGHSSLGGAAYLIENDFEDVASLRGGFEAWRREQPHESG